MDFKGIDLEEDPKWGAFMLLKMNINPGREVFSDEPCLICLGQNKEYASYLLPCNHTVHTRCFRKFLFSKQDILCPVCGPIKFDKNFPGLESKDWHK